MRSILPDSAAATEPPLNGVTVLDLTRVLSGPYCTMLLADMGARVIKIEQPGAGDDTREWGPPFVGGESTYFLSVNRNKESVALDFKHPDGRRALDRLIARADVLVENFRPSTLGRHGLDYESLAARHPRLIYASISGFGQTGPRRDEAGYDAMVQAEGGLMSITGPAGGPAYRLGVAVADITTGMFAAQGILLALLARGRTGRGQLVDVGLLDVVASLLTYQAEAWLAAGQVPARLGNQHPSIAPYDTFEAADGALVLAVGNDGQFRAFAHVIGCDDLADDPRFGTNPARVEHYATLRPLIAERVRTRPRAEWLEALRAAGVPAGSVRAIDEVFADPQIAARNMVRTLPHPTAGPLPVLGIPVQLSATPGSIRSAPPTLGQHTDSVLREDVGLSEGEIASLRESGAVA